MLTPENQPTVSSTLSTDENQRQINPLTYVVKKNDRPTAFVSSPEIRPVCAPASFMPLTPDISDLSMIEEEISMDASQRNMTFDLDARPASQNDESEPIVSHHRGGEAASLTSTNVAMPTQNVESSKPDRQAVALEISPPRPFRGGSAMPARRIVEPPPPVTQRAAASTQRFQNRRSLAPAPRSTSASQIEPTSETPVVINIVDVPAVTDENRNEENREMVGRRTGAVPKRQPVNQSLAQPKRTPARGRLSSVQSRRTPASGRSSVKAATSRLTLLKPVKSASGLVHHPNPFAARNMYYDERWIQKQENGFQKWLNFVLTPPDGFECSENDRVLLAPGKLVRIFLLVFDH
jgi:abnormal spindle-like microcephaly-associated protein